MTELTIRLSEFDSALLEDLVKNTGKSKTALVIDGLRFLYGSMRDNSPVTRLPMKEFGELLKQLEENEKDHQVLSARQNLMNTKPVWKD